MNPVNVEEQLQALREQAQRRELPPDGWPRLQRRLRREPWRRVALVAGLALAVLAAGVAPGLLARRAGQSPVPTVDEPLVPGRPVVAARIRLDRPFTDVDVSFGATWVASQGALLRIDPQTNHVVATIPVSVSGESASIAFGEGAVWVTSGQANGVVYRVDPAANRVTATIGVPGGAFGIVVAAGTVWVTQYLPEPDPGIVARIDARINRLLSSIEVPNLPGAIRAGLDAVWVTSRFTVSRIDPHSGAVTQPLHRVGDVRAIGAGSLWGTYANSATDAGAQRIDPVTGQVVATIRVPNGVLIAFGLGTLWVAQDASSIPSGGNAPDRTAPGKLYRIDPATNRVLGRPVPCRASRPPAWPWARAPSGSENKTAPPSPGSTSSHSTQEGGRPMRVTEAAQHAVTQAKREGRPARPRPGRHRTPAARPAPRRPVPGPGHPRRAEDRTRDRLVLLSLGLWSDWLELRYAVVYATPEPQGELPRPAVLGGCEVSDRAGTEYVNRTSTHPSFGMVRIHQRTFVPSPPPGTERLELRFRAPSGVEGEVQFVTSVDLR